MTWGLITVARHDFLKFRVTPEEEQRWRAAAAAARTNLSAWLRGVADLSAAHGIDVTEIRSELVALRTALNRGPGNSLNQIAKALHVDPGTARDRAAKHELALMVAADELACIRDQLEIALGSLGARGDQRRRPTRTALAAPPVEEPPISADIAAILNILDA